MENNLLEALNQVHNFEKMGIIGVLFCWIIYREYSFYKFSLATSQRLLDLSVELSSLSSDITDTNKKVLEILEEISINLKTNKETDAYIVQFIKDTCMNVKTRLDKIDEKLDKKSEVLLSELRK